MANGTHPINGLMDSSLQNLRSLVDANTVIGESIATPDGTIIIPVSKVTFGFMSGGSDLPTSKPGEPFGGGAGGGVTVQPVAFLIVKDGAVDLLQVNDNRNTADRLVGIVPDLMDKLCGMLHKEKPEETKDEEPELL